AARLGEHIVEDRHVVVSFGDATRQGQLAQEILTPNGHLHHESLRNVRAQTQGLLAQGARVALIRSHECENWMRFQAGPSVAPPSPSVALYGSTPSARASSSVISCNRWTRMSVISSVRREAHRGM